MKLSCYGSKRLGLFAPCCSVARCGLLHEEGAPEAGSSLQLTGRWRYCDLKAVCRSLGRWVFLEGWSGPCIPMSTTLSVIEISDCDPRFVFVIRSLTSLRHIIEQKYIVALILSGQSHTQQASSHRPTSRPPQSFLDYLAHTKVYTQSVQRLWWLIYLLSHEN